jgi:hypothetical protein
LFLQRSGQDHFGEGGEDIGGDDIVEAPPQRVQLPERERERECVCVRGREREREREMVKK